MGFGFLFIGYLFAFGFTSGANYVMCLVGLVGCILLCIACNKLSAYSSLFKYAKITSIILGISYISNAVVKALHMEEVIHLPETMIVVSVFTFNFLMCNAIVDIAKVAQCKKLQTSSYRHCIIMILYYLLIALTLILSKLSFPYTPFVAQLSSIVGIIWLLSGINLTLTSYIKICLPGDEDMPDKKAKK